MKDILYSLLACLIFPLYIKAQVVSKNPNHAVQNNAWVMFFSGIDFADRWKLHTEYQWRRSEYFKFRLQSLLRTGVEFEIAPTLTGTLGYGWINTFPYGEQPINHEAAEQRIWQQLAFQNIFGRIKMHHRYRLEQRWIEDWYINPDGSAIKEGYSYSNRFRYRLLINVPINKPNLTRGATFLSVYNEPFISFGDAIKNNHLDQNRFYAALGYQYSSKGNIQLGYLNQLLIKADGIRREINHTLQIGITHNLSLIPQHSM